MTAPPAKQQTQGKILSPWIFPLFDPRFSAACVQCFRGGVTNMKCSDCGAFYCNVEHQKADRPWHREHVCGAHARFPMLVLMDVLTNAELLAASERALSAGRLEMDAYRGKPRQWHKHLEVRATDVRKHGLPATAVDAEHAPSGMYTVLGALAFEQSRTRDAMTQLFVLGASLDGAIDWAQKHGVHPRTGNGRGYHLCVSAVAARAANGFAADDDKEEDYVPATLWHKLYQDKPVALAILLVPSMLGVLLVSTPKRGTVAAAFTPTTPPPPAAFDTRKEVHNYLQHMETARLSSLSGEDRLRVLRHVWGPGVTPDMAAAPSHFLMTPLNMGAVVPSMPDASPTATAELAAALVAAQPASPEAPVQREEKQ